MMSDNRNVTKPELDKIRRIDDFDLIMLISEINDHGWNVARRTLEIMPEPKDGYDSNWGGKQ